MAFLADIEARRKGDSDDDDDGDFGGLFGATFDSDLLGTPTSRSYRNSSSSSADWDPSSLLSGPAAFAGFGPGPLPRAKAKPEPLVAVDPAVADVLRACARAAGTGAGASAAAAAAAVVMDDSGGMGGVSVERAADDRVIDAAAAGAGAGAAGDSVAVAAKLWGDAFSARGGWMAGAPASGDDDNSNSGNNKNDSSNKQQQPHGAGSEPVASAAALSDFHVALLMRSALFVRTHVAVVRRHARVASVAAQRTRVATDHSRDSALDSADAPSVPAVVGIALASNFAMLKTLAAKHPDRCRQVLHVLGRMLSSLEPLALRSQQAGEELLQLQAFLAKLAVDEQQPSPKPSGGAGAATAAGAADGKTADQRGGSLEAMLSLALTRGTMDSALSAASALLNAQCPVGMPTILKELLERAQPARLTPPSAATLASAVQLATPGVDMWKGQTTALGGDGKAAADMPVAVATGLDHFFFVYCVSGLWKFGTGFGGTVAGKVYAHNASVAVKFPRERCWLMCVDAHVYLRTTTLPSGTLFHVLSGDDLHEIGTIRQDGKGVIPTDNNSGYSVLGPITDNRGPVLCDGKHIYALEVTVEASGGSSDEKEVLLSVTQFSKAGLRFLSVQELGGPSRFGAKASSNSSSSSSSGGKKKSKAKDVAVYVFGQNNCGEMGLGHTSTVNRPHGLMQKEHHSSFKAKWAAVKCGFETTYLINTKGQVYATGQNNQGQLGVGNSSNVRNLTRVSLAHVVTQVAAPRNGNHALFLTEHGDVYGSGTNSAGELGLGYDKTQNVTTPTLVSRDGAFEGQRVVFVVADQRKSGFVTADGSAWSCGYDYCGQIGCGGNQAGHAGAPNNNNNNYTVWKPKKVVLPQGDGTRRVKMIAMGYTHSNWLTNDGVIWTAGQNQYGQCGVGNKNNQQTPLRVLFPDNRRVKHIDTAYYHSVAMTADDDRVWVCGYNGHGQLGNGSSHGDSTVYVPVTAFDGKKVAHVSVGSYSNAVLLTNGEVYTWGNSSYGELGHGNSGTQYSPKKIDTFGDATGNDPSPGVQIRAISIGSCHTVALVHSSEPALSIDAFKQASWLGGTGFLAAVVPPGVKFVERKAGDADDGPRFDAKESAVRVWSLDGTHVQDVGTGARFTPYAAFNATHQRTYALSAPMSSSSAAAVTAASSDSKTAAPGTTVSAWLRAYYNTNVAILPVDEASAAVVRHTASWSPDAVLTHPSFAGVFDGTSNNATGSVRPDSEAIGVALLACLDMLAAHYLVDPYNPTAYGGSEFMRQFGAAAGMDAAGAAAAEKKARMFARALCVAPSGTTGTNTNNKNSNSNSAGKSQQEVGTAFRSLLDILGALWTSAPANLALLHAQPNPTDRSAKLALARVYGLIATLRLLLLNLKLVLARPNGALDLDVSTMRQLRELVQAIVAAPFDTVPPLVPLADEKTNAGVVTAPATATMSSAAQHAVFVIRREAAKILDTGFEAFVNTSAAKADFVLSLLASNGNKSAAGASGASGAAASLFNVTSATTSLLETCVDILTNAPSPNTLVDLLVVKPVELDVLGTGVAAADFKPEQKDDGATDDKKKDSSANAGNKKTPAKKQLPNNNPQAAAVQQKRDEEHAAAEQKTAASVAAAVASASAAPASTGADDARWRTLPALLTSLTVHTEAALRGDGGGAGGVAVSAEQSRLIARHQRAAVRLLDAVVQSLYRGTVLAASTPAELRALGTLLAVGQAVVEAARRLMALANDAPVERARAALDASPLLRCTLPSFLATLPTFSGSAVMSYGPWLTDLTRFLTELSALGRKLGLGASAADAAALSASTAAGEQALTETVVVESPHPYNVATFHRQRVHFPSADVYALTIEFDARSTLAKPTDMVVLRGVDPHSGAEYDLFPVIRGGRASLHRAFRHRSWTVAGNQCVFQLATVAAPVPTANDGNSNNKHGPLVNDDGRCRDGGWIWRPHGVSTQLAGAKYEFAGEFGARTVVRTSTAGAFDSYVRSSCALQPGQVHTWTLTVVNTTNVEPKNASLVFGVAPEHASVGAHTGAGQSLIGLNVASQTPVNAKAHRTLWTTWGVHGDTFTVTVDYPKDKVTFAHNKSEYATATLSSLGWTDRPLYPVVWTRVAGHGVTVSFPEDSKAKEAAPLSSVTASASGADRIKALLALNKADDDAQKAAASTTAAVVAGAEVKAGATAATAGDGNDPVTHWGYRAIVTAYRTPSTTAGSSGAWLTRLLTDVTSVCTSIVAHAFRRGNDRTSGANSNSNGNGNGNGGIEQWLLDSPLVQQGLIAPPPASDADAQRFAADHAFLTGLTDASADHRLLAYILSQVTVPDAKQSTASGPNLTRGVLGEPASFTVRVRDQFGHSIASAAATTANAAAAADDKADAKDAKAVAAAPANNNNINNSSSSGVKITAELFQATKKVMTVVKWTKAIHWRTHAKSLPGALSQITACATRDGKRAYLFGGYANGAESTTVHCYNADDGTFTARAKLPTANRGMGVCLLPDDTFLLVGGTRNVTYVYDPVKNTFKTPGSGAKALGWGTQVVCDSRGKVWAFGGESQDGRDKLWTYDPKVDKWAQVGGKLPCNVQCHAAAIDEKDVIYWFGGSCSNGGNNQKCYSYDTKAFNPKWQPLADVPKSMMQCGAVFIPGTPPQQRPQMVLAGGSSNVGNGAHPHYTDVYTYTWGGGSGFGNAGNVWTRNANTLPQGVRECAMVRLNGTELHLFGGYTGNRAAPLHLVGTPTTDEDNGGDGGGDSGGKKGGPVLSFDVKDQGDGTFRCVVPQLKQGSGGVAPGEYFLAVQLDGQHIRGSPFAWTVEPATGAVAGTEGKDKKEAPPASAAAVAAAAAAAPAGAAGAAAAAPAASATDSDAAMAAALAAADGDEALMAALAASAAAHAVSSAGDKKQPADAVDAKVAAAIDAGQTADSTTTTTTTTTTTGLTGVAAIASAADQFVANEQEAERERQDQLRLDALRRRFRKNQWLELTKQLSSARPDKKPELRALLAPLDALKAQIDRLESQLGLDITFGGMAPVGGVGLSANAATKAAADAKQAATTAGDGKVDALGYRTERLSRPAAALPNLNTPSVHTAKLTVFASLLKHLGLVGTAMAVDAVLAKTAGGGATVGAGAAAAATASPAGLPHEALLLYALWRAVNTRVNQQVAVRYRADDRQRARDKARRAAEKAKQSNKNKKDQKKDAEDDDEPADPFEPYTDTMTRNAQVILALPAATTGGVVSANARAALTAVAAGDAKQTTSQAARIEQVAERVVASDAVCAAVLDLAIDTPKAVTPQVVKDDVAQRELRADRLTRGFQQLTALFAAALPAPADTKANNSSGIAPLAAAPLHLLLNAVLTDAATYTRPTAPLMSAAAARTADPAWLMSQVVRTWYARPSLEAPASAVNGVSPATRAALNAAHGDLLHALARVAVAATSTTTTTGDKVVSSRFLLSLLRALDVDLPRADRQALHAAHPQLLAALEQLRKTAVASAKPQAPTPVLARQPSNAAGAPPGGAAPAPAPAAGGAAAAVPSWSWESYMDRQQLAAAGVLAASAATAAQLGTPVELLGECKVTSSGNSTDLKCIADGDPRTYWAGAKMAGYSSTPPSSWLQFELPVLAAVRGVALYVDGSADDFDLLPPTVVLSATRSPVDTKLAPSSKAAADQFTPVASVSVARYRQGSGGLFDGFKRDAVWMLLTPPNGQPFPARALRLTFEAKNMSRVRLLKVLGADASPAVPLPPFDTTNAVADAAAAALRALAL